MDLAGHRIHIFSVLTGKIDIDLLTGGMGQVGHRQITSITEIVQVLAKLTVAVASGVVLPVLTPQQPTGNAGSPKFTTEVVVALEQNRVSLIIARSEEHTSELQSRGHLVCRLLLDKQKAVGDR